MRPRIRKVKGPSACACTMCDVAALINPAPVAAAAEACCALMFNNKGVLVLTAAAAGSLAMVYMFVCIYV